MSFLTHSIGFNVAMWILLMGLLFNGVFFFYFFVLSCIEDRKFHWHYLIPTGCAVAIMSYVFY